MAQFICPNCEYIYDEVRGDPREGWPAGTVFENIDEDWTCPDCGVREQIDFIPIEEFTHNDQDGEIISKETRAAAQQTPDSSRQSAVDQGAEK